MAELSYYRMLSPEVSPTRGGETALQWETSLAPHAPAGRVLPTTLALRPTALSGSAGTAATAVTTSSTTAATSEADAAEGEETALEAHPLARLRRWEDDMEAAEAELERTLWALQPSARQVGVAAHRTMQQTARATTAEIASEMHHFGGRQSAEDDAEAMMMRLLLRTRADGGPPGIAAVAGAPSSAPLLRPWAPRPPGFASDSGAPGEFLFYLPLYFTRIVLTI